MLGTIVPTVREGLTVHTYISPGDGLEATTHILEFETQIVIVDAQYIVPYAAEANAFALELSKPITRVYVSHDHPDHWFGAAVFGAPIYALEATRDVIAAAGEAMASEAHGRLGDLVPAHAVVPTELVVRGEETIDGVTLAFDEVVGAESGALLVISAPALGLVFAQDLVYNNLHLYIAEGTLAGWADAVEVLKGRGYATILPGHGAPAGPELYDFVLAYLAVAEPLLASATGPDELKNGLIAAFPEAGGQALLDIQNGYIFAGR